MALTYFDLNSKQYKTIYSQQYKLQVEKGQGDTLMAVFPGISKEDVRMLNHDIRFIKNKTFRLRSSNIYLPGSNWYYSLFGIISLLFAAILFIRHKIIIQNADLVQLKIRRADKYAQKRLKWSAELMSQGKNEAFFNELLKAMWGYLSNKLNIPVATLSRETVKDALINRGIEDELIQEFFRIAGECEMARYAPASGNITMDKLYNDALYTISRLQQKLK
jgi:DNA-directed RNA polymerase beta subunit